MWYYNKKINATYINYTTQWTWADIDGLGWRRIKDGAADSSTNLSVLLNVAKANDRLVHVLVDADNLIQTAYLI